jgi:hypothetical protein
MSKRWYCRNFSGSSSSSSRRRLTNIPRLWRLCIQVLLQIVRHAALMRRRRRRISKMKRKTMRWRFILAAIFNLPRNSIVSWAKSSAPFSACATNLVDAKQWGSRLASLWAQPRALVCGGLKSSISWDVDSKYSILNYSILEIIFIKIVMVLIFFHRKKQVRKKKEKKHGVKRWGVNILQASQPKRTKNETINN